MANFMCQQNLTVRVVNCVDNENLAHLQFHKMTISRKQIHSNGHLLNNWKQEEVVAHRWFHNLSSRREAERILLCDKNPVGSFLVRPSSHDPSGYTLSVKAYEEGYGDHVKHHKIYALKNGQYRMSGERAHNSLPELVEAYTSSAAVRNKDEWEIPRWEITIENEIAAGYFGKVYLGRWNKRTKVAVKILKRKTTTVNAFLAEAEIMKKIRHPRLITLYGVCTTKEPIYIVTEFLKNGSLLSYLIKGRRTAYTYNNLLSFAKQIADGMKYLERKKFVHRDLAARNVLVDDNYEMKICDFGLARAIKDDVYKATRSGFPWKWTAPEAILCKTFTVKSDVWSYGILLMEIFTCGTEPYLGLDTEQLVNMLLKGYRMSKPALLQQQSDDKIYSLMLKCWSARADDRPSFAEIYEFFCKRFKNIN